MHEFQAENRESAYWLASKFQIYLPRDVAAHGGLGSPVSTSDQGDALQIAHRPV